MKLKHALGFVETLERLLSASQEGKAELCRQRLDAIRSKLQRASTDGIEIDGEVAPQDILFPEFFRDYPDLLSALAVDTVQGTIAFIAEMYTYYAEIRMQRPLTSEENQLGAVFLSCLEEAEKMLERLRERGEKGA